MCVIRDNVRETVTEVKMCVIRKRSKLQVLTRRRRISVRTESLCWDWCAKKWQSECWLLGRKRKTVERGSRQEEKDSRTRESGVTVTSIVEEDPGEEQDKEDDEDTVDERYLTSQRR